MLIYVRLTSATIYFCHDAKSISYQFVVYDNKESVWRILFPAFRYTKCKLFH